MACRVTEYQKEVFRRQQQEEQKRKEAAERQRDEQRARDSHRIASLESQWAQLTSRMSRTRPAMRLGTDQDRHIARVVTEHRLQALSALKGFVDS
jgi:sRNA-binding protein